MALSHSNEEFQTYFRGITFNAEKGGCPGNWRTPEEATAVVSEAEFERYTSLWWIMNEIEWCLTRTNGWVNFHSTRGLGSERLWTAALEIFNEHHDYGAQRRRLTRWTSFQCRWEKGREEMKKLCGER